ncbi:hypothetical protein DEU56DRAFT_297048 [Suillus clintonianus]|uniref:uncharacterized protein n=1 Tax=Suillus clintonianus TaxID=1904413 RepID=UPI001B86122C|nr:uncharacterized protein DEU56DRAFT_297048 [Suillus clintonianus]KAG2140179.1 hypothetical protein DEU56DRAFT_297048 [Suillus clintonianus]
MVKRLPSQSRSVLSTMSFSTHDLQSLQLSTGNTFGALFIGATVAAFLWGISNIQTFLYFQTHRGTGTTLFKLVVSLFWIFDALHLASIIHCIYYYLISNPMLMGPLTKVIWSFKLQIAMNALIANSVHVLYVHRVWIVSKGRSRAFPIMVGIIVALGVGVDIALISVLYRCHVFLDLIKSEWAIYTALSTITAVDITIASSLWYLLATSRTGFASTDSTVKKLIAYTINTGCITSIGSLATMITCATMPNNFIFLAVEFLVAKLYVNSFLTLLNARYYLQARADSSSLRTRQYLYRPEPHIMVSPAEEFQSSRKNMKHLDDEVDCTGPVQTDMPQRPPIAVTVEISSFSSTT